MLHILRCEKCYAYTLKKFCPKCNSKTVTQKPAKFSIEDRWGYWRRKAKKEGGLV